MEIINSKEDFTDVRFTKEEFQAFIELLKLRTGVKDYKDSGN